jgi:hypothetical protein
MKKFYRRAQTEENRGKGLLEIWNDARLAKKSFGGGSKNMLD